MWRALIDFEKRFLLAAVGIGRRPEDDEDERVRKAVLALLGLFMVTGLPIEAWFAHARGRDDTAVMMAIWSFLSLVGLIHFGATGRRWLMQTSQLLMMVIASGLAHLFMGGFEASQGFLLWGSLAPLGALLLCSRREAYVWLFFYSVVAAVVIYIDDGFAPVAIGNDFSDRKLAIFGLVCGLTGIVFILVWYFVGEIEKARNALFAKHAQLRVEQEKSERLLLNILPEPIARRLKDDRQTIADGFAEVTVLFADIVGFTALSARTGPDELVVMLNRVFSAFDEIAKRHGVEKIKTIGDAYMAASGLPEPNADHVEAMVAMALEMITTLATVNQELGTELDIRIGLHCGPVVAGVIGKHKFIYDLWGDTVNIASRMESHGQAGFIQVSSTVREQLGDSWRLESRGEVEVKGKGAMQTYFLLGRDEAADVGARS